MSDRYAASYYEQLHPAQAQAQAAMSHYAPPGYRNAPYAPVGSYNSSPYGYGYAAGGSASYMPNYYRYAPYASPHYSQPPHSHPHPLHQQSHQQPSHHHPGMFTPAGQQLIPSSVLHYPPRSHPQPQQHQHPHHLQQSLPHHAYQQPASNSSYEQPPPALYSASSYGQSRGFTAYQSSSTHYAPPGRSTTPAPNRTVLPPNYLEPMRNSFTDQQQQQQQQQLPKVEETLPELKLEHEAEAASPTQRLTTSPPLISATGTDSGISNCSTRARSDSSQSTPVYSGEYPVNMSVESASCVSYHCPADGRDYDEEQQQQQQQQQQHQQQQQQHQPQQQQETEEPKPGSVSSSSDDISATAATSTSPTSSVNDIDKAAATATAEAAEAAAATTIEAEATTATDEAQSEVVRRAEINLAKPNKEATPTPTTATKLPPQDIAEQQQQQQQPATNQINEDAAEHGRQQQQASATATSHNWSPTPRRPRTPPAPQNSPVGFSLSASSAPPTVPPALAPLLQLQQQQQHLHQPQQQHLSGNSKRHAKNRHSSNCNNNSNNSGNNRIIECDLIPSKKSKRKSSKKEADADHVDATESTVREQIRDIKPLPGFLQAFGSTEIGRFSERFLQTPESLVERLVEEYAHSNGGYATSNGYYDAPMNGAAATGVGGMHGYWPYEEQHNMAYQQSQQFARHRMRGQGYPYPDYAAYERYGYAAYSANRSRYGEIRCNGY